MYKSRLKLNDIKKDKIVTVRNLKQKLVEYGSDDLERLDYIFEAITSHKVIKMNSDSLFGFNFIKVDNLKKKINTEIENLQNILTYL
ncbi:hypothetical protein [Clostridium pasteurianum]|uniref:Uncharacterized protein n=1 Tax=Clostridium pasteurianum BC1 TaxID=86416 RepID=R4K7N9_CLOPA|nr:hypothetical protein [Clostridium pasteurianum]AGK96509.1 hypothetical protein Clopa_1581 [Clostridium pasteurianum BC1]